MRICRPASGLIALAMLSAPASAQHDPMPGMDMPMPPAPEAPAGPEGKRPQPHEMAMTGALGPYPMTRESSGTAWQPDESGHSGLHAMSGDWTLMAHGVLNLVYDHQS